jgi:hypothetical protein
MRAIQYLGLAGAPGDTVRLLRETPAYAEPVPAAGVRTALRRHVPAALADAFVQANSRSVRVAPLALGADRVVVLVRGWGADGPPRYVLDLTRPGFTASGDSAVVGLASTCGPLCGRSWKLLLTRGPSGWRVARTLEEALH